MVRGDFTRAVRYHPLGPAVILVIAALGVVGVLPRRCRDTVRRWALPWERPLQPVWRVTFGGFILFGVVRWVAVVAGLVDFPAGWP